MGAKEVLLPVRRMVLTGKVPDLSGGGRQRDFKKAFKKKSHLVVYISREYDKMLGSELSRVHFAGGSMTGQIRGSAAAGRDRRLFFGTERDGPAISRPEDAAAHENALCKKARLIIGGKIGYV